MTPSEPGDMRRTMPTTIGHITIENFLHIFDEIVENKQRCGIEAIQNSPDNLLQRAKYYGTQYKNSSWGWTSNIWSRSAGNTVVIDSEHELKNEHRTLMLKVLEQILCRPMIQVDANLGSPGSRAQMHCRLYCDPQFPDLAHRWQQLNFLADPGEQPQAPLFFLPQYLENPNVPGGDQMLRVIRFPNHNYTVATATSYQGEIKKGFLAHWVLHCYQQGGTGEHASLKEFTVRKDDGTEKRIVMGCWGLSGTGKSTHGLYVVNEHTAPLFKKQFGIDIEKYVYDQALKNDDITGWWPDQVVGSEIGAWTKTEDVDRDQVAIYDAARDPHALHENTEWDENGDVSFAGELFQYNGVLNRNARTVLRMEDTGYFDGSVDSTIPPNMAVFISPGHLSDYAWLKITDPNFAAKVLADGRTVGHPAQEATGVGQTKYETRYCLPFTMGIGSAEHVHRFRDLIADKVGTDRELEVYQISTTGRIGANYEWVEGKLGEEELHVPQVVFRYTHGKPTPEGGTSPSIEETELFLFQAAREAVEYEPHPVWGDRVLVPVEVPGISSQRLAELAPTTYRDNEELESLLYVQVLISKYTLHEQAPGLDREIYYAMDF